MGLGFQRFDIEVDSLPLVKRVIELYLDPDGQPEREGTAIGVRIVTPGEKLPSRFWNSREHSDIMPLMVVTPPRSIQSKDPSCKPWSDLDSEPTYVLASREGYGAISQFLQQLDHFLLFYNAEWLRGFAKIPVPVTDGSVATGFVLHSGGFFEPLVISWCHIAYHK